MAEAWGGWMQTKRTTLNEKCGFLLCHPLRLGSPHGQRCMFMCRKGGRCIWLQDACVFLRNLHASICICARGCWKQRGLLLPLICGGDLLFSAQSDGGLDGSLSSGREESCDTNLNRRSAARSVFRCIKVATHQ